MQNDFGKGSIFKVVMVQAVPLMMAQLVHLLYNVVDRIYIGHLEGIGSIALTGIGLAFPLTTLIAAFTNLFATGGTPLFAICRGRQEEEKAERILSQVAGNLIITSVILFLICWFLRKPILYAFGASDQSYIYADQYLRIYLWGTTFTMLATGLNGFINASGFPRIGMMTVMIGAALNLVLDPVFIFLFHMNVAGAALATVISQLISCIWAVAFFTGGRAPYRIIPEGMIPDFSLLKDIVPLGIAGFVMQGTNAAVQIVCNVMLRTYGGDLYVGIMTVINSIREIFSLPVQSITHGSQPVMSFNFGAKKYSRVKSSIKVVTMTVLIYTVIAWAAVILFPKMLMSIFTDNAEMIEAGAKALNIYFFGFVFMTFQSAGQAAFTAMRCTKRAIFFSIFRKLIIVVPLTLLLPRIGYGADGVYLAEPISNVMGGLAAFTGMYLTLYRKLPADGEEAFI